MAISSAVKKTHFFKAFYYVGIFIFFAVLTRFFVPVNDDIFFSYKFGEGITDAVVNAVRYGNGRILGNFSEIVIQHYEFLKLVVIPACLVWVISLINRFGCVKDKKLYFMSLFLIVTMSPSMFADTIHWMAAFCNYVIPIAIFMESFYLLQNSDKFKNKVLVGLAIAVLSFSGCFFSENTTVVFLFVFSSIFAVDFVRRKTFYVLKALGAIGVFTGTILMFVTPKFVGRDGAMSSYRHTVFEKGIVGGIKFVYGQTNLIAKALVGWFVIFAVLTVAVILVGQKTEMSKKQRFVFRVSGFAQILAIIYFVADYIFIIPIEFENKLVLYVFITVRILAVCVYFVAMLLNIFIVDFRLNGKKMLFVPWLLLIVISILPFVIIEPIGPRVVFMPFVFLCVIATKMINVYITEFYGSEKIFVVFKNMLLIATGSSLVFLLCVFPQINEVYYIRDAYIREQVKQNQTTITIPELPFENYVNFPREDYTWDFHFGYEEGTVEFEYLPYAKWQKLH